MVEIALNAKNHLVFHNILIPTDFSPAAWRAIQAGVHVGRRNQSSIFLLHVYPNPAPFDLEDEASLVNIKSRMQQFVDNLVVNNHPTIKSHVTTGIVEEELLKFIQEHPVDLVILGVNGNGQDNHVGSNAARILHTCNAPVMIVPNALAYNLATSV